MGIHHTDTATSSIFLLCLARLASIFHQCLILCLLFIHRNHELLMQTTEKILVTLELKGESMVCSAHLFHILIDHLFHFNHTLLHLARLPVQMIG